MAEEFAPSVNSGSNKESFLVQIHFQQNASWQGTLTWIEKKKVQRFRSTLEMIKLMDSAISAQPEENPEDWK